MNVLVTGAAGLIGMAARPVLAAAGHTLVPVDVTSFGRTDPDLHQLALADTAGIERLVKERSVDAIVHCGAISGPMMAQGQPLELVSVNIDATRLSARSRASFRHAPFRVLLVDQRLR